MTSNVLCKYYMNGACAYGDQCRFSHNKQEEASQVCKFYLQGNCAYGDKCRYEHSKPSWSSRGQPSGPSNYTAPPAVPKPPVGPPGGIAKLPSGASDLGLTSSGNPNWDDYMTPDEVDEFEAWQAEQQQTGRPGAGGPVDDEFGDIMDPADIPLCNEYAATGFCSAGEDCLYVHGDVCEICGYYCVHPYNPDWTAQHQEACRAAMSGVAPPPPPAAPAPPAAAAPRKQQQPNNTAEQEQAAPAVEEQAGAADAAMGEATAGTDKPAEAAADAAAVEESSPEVAATVAAAVAAVVEKTAAEDKEAAADEVAEKLADAHISNADSVTNSSS